MKRSLLLLPICLVLLSGCNQDKISNKPKYEVDLSASNVYSYVSKQQSSTLIRDAGTYSDMIYYCHFVGADYCKFVDCELYYEFWARKDNSIGERGSIHLTLSGDGDAWPFYVYQQNKTVYYECRITGASGTVLVYR